VEVLVVFKLEEMEDLLVEVEVLLQLTLEVEVEQVVLLVVLMVEVLEDQELLL
jgi:hypothetical protein